MEMTGEFRIPAPRQRVWEGLNDPEILKGAIPGCQTLEKVSDTEFAGKVVAAVGPVKATFGGKVTLSDLDPRIATPSAARAAAASPVLPKAAPR